MELRELSYNSDQNMTAFIYLSYLITIFDYQLYQYGEIIPHLDEMDKDVRKHLISDMIKSNYSSAENKMMFIASHTIPFHESYHLYSLLGTDVGFDLIEAQFNEYGKFLGFLMEAREAAPVSSFEELFKSDSWIKYADFQDVSNDIINSTLLLNHYETSVDGAYTARRFSEYKRPGLLIPGFVAHNFLNNKIEWHPLSAIPFLENGAFTFQLYMIARNFGDDALKEFMKSKYMPQRWEYYLISSILNPQGAPIDKNNIPTFLQVSEYCLNGIGDGGPIQQWYPGIRFFNLLDNVDFANEVKKSASTRNTIDYIHELEEERDSRPGLNGNILMATNIFISTIYDLRIEIIKKLIAEPNLLTDPEIFCKHLDDKTLPSPPFRLHKEDHEYVILSNPQNPNDYQKIGWLVVFSLMCIKSQLDQLYRQTNKNIEEPIIGCFLRQRINSAEIHCPDKTESCGRLPYSNDQPSCLYKSVLDDSGYTKIFSNINISST